MAAPTAAISAQQQQFFESKVRPLLSEHCFSCHGEKKQKGGLRLDSPAALKGGKNGVVLVPGKPEQSKLVVAVSYKDDDLQMPPDEPLSAEQVQVLTDWVKMGAPWPASAAGTAVPLAKGRHRTISDADRAFWSFQPVTNPNPPALEGVPAEFKDWCRNPIDQFVLAKLRSEGLTPAPEADRLTLIRRATFDLDGLPPTPAEVDAFVRDPSPNAYEKLIDRLLASPRYGERWGRHWLDLVRYAESDGFKQDAYRPNAWPYRDYVIKSLNEDKPYDRFVAEQLAGDEIAPGDPDALVATGYLRHTIYEYNQRDVPKQWQQMLEDVTDVTGDAFLGLSVGCAKCHDHKFDPILQSDYYRLQAFFAPMLPRDDLPRVSAEERRKHDEAEAEWERMAGSVREQVLAIEKKAADKAGQVAVRKFPENMQAIMRLPTSARSPLQEQWAQLAFRQVHDQTENPQPKLSGAEKEKYEALKKQLAEFDAQRPPPLPKAMAVTDVGPTPPPTTIPGDPQHPLEPGPLTVLQGGTIPGLTPPQIVPTPTSTGRRVALARWITQPANPLTSRVIVNRVWQYHFGRGLVETSSDFGHLGTPPSHPELLDWLATRLTRDEGWRLKPLHRLIMTSAAYRQSSLRPSPEVARMKDPDNRWLWRANLHRLDAEQVRDAILATSGELQTEAGGPPADPASARRSVYTKVLRNTRDPLLDAFDAPDSFGSIAIRNVTTTASQSLLMINGDWPLKRAAAFAALLKRDAHTADPAVLADAAYHLAYGRPPTEDERRAAVEFLTGSADGGNQAAGAGKLKDDATLVDFCHALLNSNEFLYVD